MTYGFTGAHRLTEDQRALAESYLAALTEDWPLLLLADGFVTGTQVGIDELVARTLAAEFPTRPLTQLIPGKPGTHGEIVENPGARVIQLTDRDSSAMAYRKRNHFIVELADALIAFPEGPEESHRRSGTWMTVRMAREKGIPVRVFPLDGSAPYEEAGS